MSNQAQANQLPQADLEKEQVVMTTTEPAAGDGLDMHAFWHSSSHLLAHAVKRLWPETKLAIGPAIENGFYYDFDREGGFSEEDLEAIEDEMKKIVKANYKIERFSLPRNQALEFVKKQDEPYKLEMVEALPEDEEISFYRQDDFTDLCAGPHVRYTKQIKAFKLTSVSGA